jgi:hypothetical protein
MHKCSMIIVIVTSNHGENAHLVSILAAYVVPVKNWPPRDPSSVSVIASDYILFQRLTLSANQHCVSSVEFLR